MTENLIRRDEAQRVIKEMKRIAETFENETYYTGYVVALSTLEGRLAEMEAKPDVP